MSKRKANPAISTYKAIKKMRGDWGQINPVTKIIPNKKKNYEYDNDYYSIDDCCHDLEYDPYEEDDYIYADNDEYNQVAYTIMKGRLTHD